VKAIELSPRQPAYYSNRAFCELKLEEYGSALMDADRAIELDRTFIKAYYRRGAAHLALGKYKDARGDFKTVVKIKPSDKDAQNKLKECEKAIYAAAFNEAIAGVPRKPASETVGDQIAEMTIESSQ
jgi:serine/threonine-protein phosphatase 5